MDLLLLGAQWAQTQRHTTCTQNIQYNGVPMKATISETDVEVERGGVKLLARFSKFVVRTSDLKSLGVKITRGHEVLWGSNVYEVTNEGSTTNYYNDPFELDTVIVTVKR